MTDTMHPVIKALLAEKPEDFDYGQRLERELAERRLAYAIKAGMRPRGVPRPRLIITAQLNQSTVEKE